MLIDFRVKNYRSIRDEQILSLEASGSRSELKEVLHRPAGLPANAHLLPTIAVFGANASGKTNLIRAMAMMRNMVLHSFSKAEEDDGPIQAMEKHLLDPNTLGEPVEFEVTFVHEGVRHRYGFATHDAKIVSESLTIWPKKQPRLVFARGLATGDDEKPFKAGDDIAGGRE